VVADSLGYNFERRKKITRFGIQFWRNLKIRKREMLHLMMTLKMISDICWGCRRGLVVYVFALFFIILLLFEELNLMRSGY
jgi:hypothetical protein